MKLHSLADNQNVHMASYQPSIPPGAQHKQHADGAKRVTAAAGQPVIIALKYCLLPEIMQIMSKHGHSERKKGATSTSRPRPGPACSWWPPWGRHCVLACILVVIVYSMLRLTRLRPDQSPGTPTASYQPNLGAIEQLIRSLNDSGMQKAFLDHQTALRTDPRNTHAAVNMANLAVQALERQAFLSAPTSSTTAATYDATAEPAARARLLQAVVDSAGSLFGQAISAADHFGAHYSMGLLLKLYPSFLTARHQGGAQSSSGYQHMCDSMTSFAKELSRAYRQQCGRGVEVVRAWNRGQGIPGLVDVRYERRAGGREGRARQQHACVRDSAALLADARLVCDLQAGRVAATGWAAAGPRCCCWWS